MLWHLKTPKEWNEKDVADALKNYERMSDNQDIKIKFVREGSLILLTTVPYGILHDKDKYEHAIQKFLTRMMDVCNIDTKRACHVKATLHILKHDEGKLLFSLARSFRLCLYFFCCFVFCHLGFVYDVWILIWYHCHIFCNTIEIIIMQIKNVYENELIK